MKRARIRRSLVILGIGTAVGLVTVHLAGKRVRASAGPAMPPVDRLVAFSLSNAPRTSTATGWSTNDSANAAIAKLLQGRVTNRSSQAVTTVAAKPGNNFRDADQAEAFQRLRNQVGPSLQVFLRPTGGTPMQIKGNPLMRGDPSIGDPVSRDTAAAMAFFRENTALLLLQNPEEELRLAHREVDELGKTTLRFTQYYQGIQVWPAEIGAHLDAHGDLTVFDGAYEATSNLSTTPTLTAAEAQTKALAAVSEGKGGTATTPTLVVYARLEQPPRLAWKLEVSVALDRYWSVAIDAGDGSTLRAINLCTTESVPGSGIDLLGTTRTLNAWHSGPTYYLWDTTKPMFDPTKATGLIITEDALGENLDQLMVDNTFQNLYYVTATSPNSWNNPDAVSCAYNLAQTYDYYRERFGRDSYDGKRSDLTGIVRIGNWANACWNQQFKTMLFGNIDRYAASLDVIGHEVTHGVIYSIGTQGVLQYQDQPGALNEAFADIFGEMVEARTRGTNDWLLGSELMSIGRSMPDPAAYHQPAKMSQYVTTSQDNGGVHVNSGIINHAYFLLAAGLPGAIGSRDAERVFYRSLTQYLKPLSQFVDARLACITAAEDLFGAGSVQALKTAEAFDAVEIYASPASAPEPANVNAAVQAADSALFIQEHWFWNRDDLWRYEAAQGDSGDGTSLVTGVKLSRPSVSGDGKAIFFVGADESLCMIGTTGSGFTNLGFAGRVHSVAISPNARYGAFVFNASNGVPTNTIILIDFQRDVTVTVDLKTPVTDGPALNNISYADSLAFSPDERILIYDALSTHKDPAGRLRRAWSVFALEMSTLHEYVIVPPTEDFQICNPIFGHTSTRFVAMDAQYTNGNTAVLTLDLFAGTLGVVGAK